MTQRSNYVKLVPFINFNVPVLQHGIKRLVQG